MYTRRWSSTISPRSGDVALRSQFAKRALGRRESRTSAPRAVVFPGALPCRVHRVRILGPSEAAVVAAERAEEIALLDVEVVAQDDAAIAQVGAQIEKIVARPLEYLGPEWHYLHVALCAGP